MSILFHTHSGLELFKLGSQNVQYVVFLHIKFVFKTMHKKIMHHNMY